MKDERKEHKQALLSKLVVTDYIKLLLRFAVEIFKSIKELALFGFLHIFFYIKSSSRLSSSYIFLSSPVTFFGIFTLNDT